MKPDYTTAYVLFENGLFIGFFSTLEYARIYRDNHAPHFPDAKYEIFIYIRGSSFT